MAVIDFKCNDCGEKFFEIVSIADRDKVKCPKCGSHDVGQVFEGQCAGAKKQLRWQLWRLQRLSLKNTNEVAIRLIYNVSVFTVDKFY